MWCFQAEQVLRIRPALTIANSHLSAGPWSPDLYLTERTHETATGHNFRLVRDIYYTDGSTERSLPILYDKKNHCIVSNESADIIRMLNRWAGTLRVGSQT